MTLLRKACLTFHMTLFVQRTWIAMMVILAPVMHATRRVTVRTSLLMPITMGTLLKHAGVMTVMIQIPMCAKPGYFIVALRHVSREGKSSQRWAPGKAGRNP